MSYPHKDDEDRAAHIKGLRDLADFLEANPDVPVGRYNEVKLQYSVSAYSPWKRDYEAARIEVDRVARLINRDATDDDDKRSRRRETTRRFGPVYYLAIAIEELDES